MFSEVAEEVKKSPKHSDKISDLKRSREDARSSSDAKRSEMLARLSKEIARFSPRRFPREAGVDGVLDNGVPRFPTSTAFSIFRD